MKLPDLNYKKIGLVVGFLATSIFLGWLIYSVFFRAPVPPTVGTGDAEIKIDKTTQPLDTEKRLPISDKKIAGDEQTIDKTAQGGLTLVNKLVEDNTGGVTLDHTGMRSAFYNKKDGKFYIVDKNGKTTLLSDEAFYNVRNINWSDDKERVILEYPDGSNIVYDFSSSKQITLPKNWDGFQFSSGEKNKIATKSLDQYSKNNKLIIAGIDSGSAKVIENIGTKRDSFQINWSPDNQVVAFFIEGVDFSHQEVYFVGQHNENFKSIIVDGYGFKGKWSPDGNIILYSVYSDFNNYKPMLWITNKDGSFKRRLNVDTWVDKCTFYNKNIIYCGVPKYIEEMMGPSPNLAINISDDIYRIDISKNLTEKIAIPATNQNIDKLMVSSNEKILYFKDRRTGRIYKIDL